jgi:hypothetical protein
MAAGLHPARRGCESLRLDHFHSLVVQPVERRIVNADVAGAEPARGASFWVASFNSEAAGSYPAELGAFPGRPPWLGGAAVSAAPS